MIWFAARKFAGLVATLVVAALVVYLLLGLAPREVAPKGQFFEWLGGMLIGNFGVSSQKQPVGGMIGGALAVTVPLMLMAVILSSAIGLGIGVLAARRPRSVVDRALMVLTEIGVAVPNFWLGMLLVVLFSVILHWFPPGGFVPWTQNPAAAFASLILPAFALALPQAATLGRAARRALVEAKESDYVRAAEARGLTARDALRRHGLRNAALAVLGTLGLQFGWLFAATVIVENVFYLSGIGRLIFDAIATRDLAVVRSAVLVLMLGIAGTMFLVDLAAGWVDPRLRQRRGA